MGCVIEPRELIAAGADAVTTAEGYTGGARESAGLRIHRQAARQVPPPLTEQLAEGGRLVVPVGERHDRQELVRIVRRGDDLDRTVHGAVMFVAFVGDFG